VPKVIDFGVAKAISQPLTERTLVTEQGQYDEAEALLVKGLETSRRVLGEENLQPLHFMNGLGLVYCGQGRYNEAEALLVKALEVSRRKFGEQQWRTLE